MDAISSRTRVFALLGDPVAHSLSPLVQNSALQASGKDGVYVAIRTGAEDLVGLIRGLARGGGGGNVTLPHKERAASLVESPSPAVRRTGACNTFWLEDGRIHGDNSDVEGFRRALASFLGGSPEGFRVLLLGAGGAARASLMALLDDGAREILLLNRTRDRARIVAWRLGGDRVRVLDDAREVEGESFDLVVNTTRLGLEPSDPLPLELELLDRVGGVLDLVYGHPGTPFTRRARELGMRAADGAEMLVQQGIVAFERWWGEAPSPEVMRQALRERPAP